MSDARAEPLSTSREGTGLRWLPVALAAILLDQIIKAWVIAELRPGVAHHILPVLDFTNAGEDQYRTVEELSYTKYGPKLKIRDPLNALDKLMRHRGLMKDKAELSGPNGGASARDHRRGHAGGARRPEVQSHHHQPRAGARPESLSSARPVERTVTL